MENNAASPPVYILNAACVEQKDYVKRKHVFKLATTVFFIFMLIYTNFCHYSGRCRIFVQHVERR
jgi:hypothetical protein